LKISTTHFLLLDWTSAVIHNKTYKLGSLLKTTGTSSPLGPNALLSTIFSDTYNLLSSSSVFQKPNKMAGKVHFTLLFMLYLVVGRSNIFNLRVLEYLYADFLLNSGDET
jgi:hypothetical protein